MKVFRRITKLKIHISLQEQVQPAFYLIMHFIAFMQTVANLVPSTSHLKTLVFWTDPSTYQPSSFVAPLTASMVFLALLLVIVRCWTLDDSDKISKPSIFLKILDTVTLYTLTICKTIILSPLLRSSLQQIRNSSNSGILVISCVSLFIFMMVIYPIGLFVSSNTSVLTTSLDRKIGIFNPDIVFHLFRIPMAITSQFLPISQLIVGVLYMLMFAFAKFKQPITSFKFSGFSQLITSCTAFICFTSLVNTIFHRLQGSVIIEIIGMICFWVFMQVVSQFHIKKIMESDELTVKKIKILIFMVCNLEDYQEQLSYFIIQHHAKCTNPSCGSQLLIERLSSPSTTLPEATLWFSFIADFIQMSFNMENMQKLPKSQMAAQTQQMRYLIPDLSQIYLFSLKRPNKAYILLTSFQDFLRRGKLEHLWIGTEFTKLRYSIETALQQNFRTDKKVNFRAQSYRNYQADCQNYLNILVTTAQETLSFWTQLINKQPHEDTLLSKLLQIQKKNQVVKQMYYDITEVYRESKEVLQNITHDYYFMVLNVVPGEPFHAVEKVLKVQNQKNGNVKCCDEDMEAFSGHSETPIFFISAEENIFGQILGGNRSFQEARDNWLGNVANVDEMVMPEMRESHHLAMKKMIEGDSIIYQHASTFLLTHTHRLVGGRHLIQIVPSLKEGLHYAVFLKKVDLKTKMIAIDRQYNIVHSSELMVEDRIFGIKISELLPALQSTSIIQVPLASQQLLTFPNKYVKVKLISQSPEKNLSILQIITSKKALTMALPKTKSNSRRKSRVSLMSDTWDDEITFQQITGLKKTRIDSKIMENTADRQKKEQKKLMNAFVILSNKSRGEKNICIYNVIAITVTLLIIFLLVGSILSKNTHQQVYVSTFENKQKYFSTMQNVARSAIYLKQTNLYSHQALMNSSRAFSLLLNTSSINEAMKDFMDFFPSEIVTQDWTTFTLQTNKTFTTSTLRNYLSITDYLEIPIHQLKQLNPTDLNFSFSLEYLSVPLTSPQQKFYTFLINALYVSIPNLSNLERSTLQSYKSEKFRQKSFVTVFGSLILILGVIYMLAVTIISKRIMRINNESHHFLEDLSPHIIEEKIKGCSNFIENYSPSLPKTDLPAPSPTEEPSSDMMSLNPTLKNETDRQIDCERIQSHGDSQKLEDQEPTHFSQGLDEKKREKKAIFSQPSYIKLFMVRLITGSPFLLCAVLFIVWEQSQAQMLQSYLTASIYSMCSKMNLLVIYLYALHNGIYQSSLQQYFSIPGFLKARLYQMFQIMQYQLSTLIQQYSAHFRELQYNDICHSDQAGVFPDSEFIFEGRFDYSQCASIAQASLTKGFSSAFLSFLEGANNLILAHPETLDYSSDERLDYFGHPFFMKTSRLIDYLSLVLDSASRDIRDSFLSTLNYNTRVLTSISLVLISILTLVFFLRRKTYSNRIHKQILQIKATFQLISAHTLLQHPALKQRFQASIEDMTKLK